MHICFLCNEYPPGRHGGVGTFTQTLGRSLVARGHQVTVLGVYKGATGREDDDRGVRVIRLGHSGLPKTGFLINGRRIRQELAKIHLETPIDILEGPELSLASISNSFPAVKIIRMNGGHHFFSVTLGKKPRPWRGWLEKRSFSHADRVSAVSHFVAETTRDLLKLNGAKIEILPNPVDVSKFHPLNEVTEEPGLLVFAGTVCEKKGIRQLVQAMPSILEAVPHARLLVLGRDWHDPQTGQSFTAYLRTLIPPHIKSHIIFEGSVDNSILPTYLARAQVCLYPSHMEALPLAWLEGLAMAKAIVASRTGPGPEVIEDGASGLLCDPYDPKSIAEKVIALLKDERLRGHLGAEARARAVNHFSIDTLVKKNEAFYRECLKERRGA